MHGLDVSAIERELANAIDPQVRRGILFYTYFVSCAQGDYVAASNRAEQATLDRPQLGMWPNAAIAAAISGDRERVRALLDRAAGQPINGRLGAAWMKGATSLALAMDGRVNEAPPGLREALRTSREMGAVFGLGQLSLAMLRILGPESPDARAAGEEALANYERMKAWPMAEQIRAALAGREPGQPTDKKTLVTPTSETARLPA